MSDNKTPNIKITIDNINIEVPLGTSILEAARKIGGEVAPPTMCYYSKLENSGGKCRTCLVEVSQGSTADPRPMPKLVASCRTGTMDGMVVKNITSTKVQAARKSVVEFLLINHPLDCPVCDQAGECDLQNLSYEHGADTSRFDFSKRTFEKEDIGPYIQLHMNRCILCYRCVYAADQLTGERNHGILDRGEHAQISTHIKQSINHKMSGNIIDVCPVGALTDKTNRFKNRVWFLKPFDAHRNCKDCCGKVVLWNRGDDIYRITGRKDAFGEVEEWICNTCRFEKKNMKDWTIEGISTINNHSVISQNHHQKKEVPNVMNQLLNGHDVKKTLDIHSVSEVNKKKNLIKP